MKITNVRFINAVNLSCSAQTPHLRLFPTHKQVKEMTFNDNFVIIIDINNGINYIPMVNVSSFQVIETPKSPGRPPKV